MCEWHLLSVRLNERFQGKNEAFDSQGTELCADFQARRTLIWGVLFQLYWRVTFFVCNKTTVKSYMTKTNEKSQQAFTCSKLTIETLEQGVKYVQNEQWRYQKFPSLKTELRIITSWNLFKSNCDVIANFS